MLLSASFQMRVGATHHKPTRRDTAASGRQPNGSATVIRLGYSFGRLSQQIAVGSGVRGHASVSAHVDFSSRLRTLTWADGSKFVGSIECQYLAAHQLQHPGACVYAKHLPMARCERPAEKV